MDRTLTMGEAGPSLRVQRSLLTEGGWTWERSRFYVQSERRANGSRVAEASSSMKPELKAAYSLPTPKVASPLPPVDPYRHKKAYHRLLSMLFHAEKAALEGFELLTDPLFVESHPL